MDFPYSNGIGFPVSVLISIFRSSQSSSVVVVRIGVFRHAGAPGSLPGWVGLSEINFSDLYCGWLGRIINVEYNTTHNTTPYTGARWFGGMFGALQLEGCGFESTSKSPRRDPGQVLHSQLLMRFGVKLRLQQ